MKDNAVSGAGDTRSSARTGTTYRFSVMSVFCLLWLSGCAQPSSAPEEKTVPDTTVVVMLAPRPVPEVPDAPYRPSQLTVCIQELEALEKTDRRRYLRRQKQFSRLDRDATAWAGIRGTVSPTTQEAVDAMYRYKTTVLCAAIAMDMLDGLTRLPGSRL